MPEENKTTEGFTQRPLEQPILDSRTRGKLAQSEPDRGTSSLSGRQAESASFYASNKFYIWAAVIGLVAIGVLSFFAFRKTPPVKPAEAKVAVTVDAPQAVASGGEVIYKIKVENQDSQTLVDQELELAYPNGFSYISSSPKADNLSHTVFQLPDLTPGQNVVVVVKAKATGNVNDQKELVMKLRYKLANFNSEFVKEQKFSVRLVAAQISFEIQGPQTTSNAQLVAYTVTYKNNSSEQLKNARVRFNFPDGFSFAASQPEADLGNNVWNVAQVNPGDEGKITIQGDFKRANAGESKTITAEFLVLSGNGEYFLQNSASFVTQLSNLPLTVSQEVEGGEGAVSPGDNLRVIVTYRNNATTEARGVNIQVNLDSKALNLSSLRSEGAVISNNSITWNAAGVPQLESLNPGEQGSIAFSVDVNDPATRDSSRNLQVVSTAKIKSNEYDTYFPGNELRLKVASPVELTSRLEYVSGARPPQAGNSTTYRVTLSFKNATNDYSDTVVYAFIPLGAGGFDSGSITPAETGKVNFDPSTGKLTWNVGALPAHTGTFSKARTLEFQVRLNASASQVGQSPTLAKDISFTATDTFLEKAVTGTASNLTTSSLTDGGYYGGGQVVE